MQKSPLELEWENNMNYNYEVVVNADDFGISSVTTEAIIKFIKEGYCDTTTVMVNMPGYLETFELANKEGIVNNIGLHLNLSEGPAITNDMKNCRTFCNESGNFDFRYKKNLQKRFILNSKEKIIVSNEIEAQLKRYISLGYSGYFLDSHQGIHMDWSLYPIIINLFKKYKFKRIRRSPNLKSPSRNNNIKKIIHMKYDRNIKINDIYSPDYLGNIRDYRQNNHKISNGTLVEIMTHPSIKDDVEYIDVFSNFQLDDYKSDLEQLNHQKASFNNHGN